MKKLFIHIGLSKTGTSAIQSWLSLNVNSLAKQGVDYADLSPAAKKGKITSGNGVLLFNACKAENYAEVERLILDVYFKQNKVAIISSEALQNIPPLAVTKIADICKKNGIDVTVVAYIRSVYECIYSNYLQGIKRHGATKFFGEQQDFSYRAQMRFLKNYFDVFGNDLCVHNYDHEKGNIFQSFSNLIGINFSKTEVKNKKVNRSLTFTEGEVLREMNCLHHGLFSTAISDYLISKYPEKQTHVFYTEKLIQQVEESCSASLTWINSNLLDKQHALVAHNQHGKGKAECCDSKNTIFKNICEWVLSHNEINKEKEFVDFIRDFAVKIEKKHLVLAHNLMAKAHLLRPDGEFINTKLFNYKLRLDKSRAL